MPEITLSSAAYFDIALDAAERGNRALAVGALMSIPHAELAAIRARTENWAPLPELDLIAGGPR